MKKRIAIVLVFVLILTSLMSGCGASSDAGANNLTEKISLTKDNFNEYFNISTNSNVTTIKESQGGVILGIYTPATYSGTANVDVSVTAAVPLKAYNVTVKVRIPTDNIWEEKQKTLTLSSDGSGNASVTVKTLEKNHTNASLFSRDQFSAWLVSVEGEIELN